ncbi:MULTISPECIES: molybdate ABC transporter substrate-binding protein [Cellulomonas]|uniref:Molybdate-binding protein n=2 Tax=Cellulomonas TaxID=1707 RepID=A0A4Y3KK65_9CELL|nr:MULTISPECIES: molybdate ABC transporter substrate-binding protein [Cellulomonas]MCR6704019.1 molybdate ABC transporter substrate-binding protein [Cellulomonas sp.]GEA84026.1 molybdate-binding protein [Cellulomonas gelida]GGL23818.1 molybdate-binding protein [Cellulomonas gelida]
MTRPVGSRGVVATIAAGVALLALAGCGSSAGGVGGEATPGGGARAAASSASATASADTLSGEVTVFAAASLEPVLDELAAAFVAEHPAVTFAPVTYDGSSTLATQLAEGARADVLATADRASMQDVVDEGLVEGEPTVVTTNTLQIVVPPGNPDHVGSLADLGALAGAGGKVVVCAAEVPCGKAAAAVLDAAHVALAPASLEQNVTAVLTKVREGEADAGLVYRTDVLRAGDAVEGVDFAESADAVNEYPVAVLRGAAAPGAAAAFVDFVLSSEGQALLTARGFTPAP